MNRALALALVAAFSTGPAVAQDQPAGFTEQVEVRVMDLDVVVTDRDGKPVRDLKREDFTVRLGGKVVPIDYFARVDAGAIHVPDLATASPEQVLAPPERTEPVYLPRYFLIYVDLGHMSPVWKRRALEPLRDLVARFGPNDHGRVLMFDRRSTVLTEWTSKKEALLAALSGVDKTVGMSRLISERQARNSIDHPPGLTPPQRSRYVEFVVSQYTAEARAATRDLLRDVESGLAALAPLAGKKSFLFVSGGFDFQPGLAMGAYGLGRSGFLTRDSRNLSAELDAIVKRANASEITFYAMDARGLDERTDLGDASDPLPDLSLPEKRDFSSLALHDSQQGMVHLAHETGGIALMNTNDLGAGLSRVHEDTSSYYSIGVTLSKLPSAAYQNVRVEVSRPGVVVRTRRGYAAMSEADRARDRVQATLRTNLRYSAIPVTMRTGKADRKGGRYTLPIFVTIPASGLTFLAEGGSRRATADVYVAAMDDQGRMSEISRNDATFTLPAGGDETTPLVHSATLLIRKGKHRIVVNVRDKVTGKMGTAKADVRVD
ncbi:MAG: VWA domain-containing protein [Acidobacteriota bacterium]|nr:VWA domain-containing protein [Acidobacteriota bacterium]